MSDTRYGHTSVGGGDQDQGERKDEGWQRRQGGDQSREPGGRDEPNVDDAGDATGGRKVALGTNTQGELAGIGEASRRSAERLDAERAKDAERANDADTGGDDGSAGQKHRGDDPGAGTDQPPRMGGPLGPDSNDPHLPEGAQTTETRGTGAGGFDVGVNAKVVGAVHQGAREEDPAEPSPSEGR